MRPNFKSKSVYLFRYRHNSPTSPQYQNYAHRSFDVANAKIRVFEPIGVVQVMRDPFSLIRQQTADWLKASGYHRNELAKELNWSESFLSEFMSGKSGLGGLKLCQLAAVVSQPPKLNKPNKGARICGIQSMGRTVKGILELNEANLAEFADKHIETNLEQMREDIRNHNKGTAYDLNRE